MVSAEIVPLTNNVLNGSTILVIIDLNYARIIFKIQARNIFVESHYFLWGLGLVTNLQHICVIEVEIYVIFFNSHR